jgi:hypothetical protein
MTRRRDTKVGDFALHPKVRKVVFQEISDLLRQFGNRENIGKRKIHRFIRFPERVFHVLHPEDMLTITERRTPVKVVRWLTPLI